MFSIEINKTPQNILSKRHETCMEYKLRFHESDLVERISEEMRRKFPALDLSKILKLSKDSVEEIKSQGNNAAYEGLVLFGEKEATKAYQRIKSEGRDRCQMLH